MAMPRRRSRSITVDGADYRWMVSDEDDQYPGFVATLTSAPRCPLIWTRYGGEPDIITPGLVADGIRAGLQQGWLPAQPGRPFRMRNGEHFDVPRPR